jgi:RNA polymerase sigma factor (sigma-70 family)
MSPASAQGLMAISASSPRSRPERLWEPPAAGRLPCFFRGYDPAPMIPQQTTVVVQRYLDAIAGDDRAETMVRELLDQSVRRLQVLCSNLLHRNYPRLLRSPVSVEPEDVLSAVVARLIKALRSVRPGNVRQFFALANKHMRWELNELARGLDQRPPVELVAESGLRAAADSGSGLSPNSHRMLGAIEALPEDEREAFSLVRIQGMSNVEAAEVLGVSSKTIQRRITRSMWLLAEALDDLRPPGPAQQGTQDHG